MKVFDLHCDTMMGLARNNLDLVNDKCHISLDKAAKFERYTQCYAIFIPDMFRGQEAIDYFDKGYAYFKGQMAKYADCLDWVRSGAELDAATKQFVGILTIEGGCALAGDLSRVKWLKDCGVAMMTLTWNGANEIGYGTAENKGLTAFGKEALKEMEKVGMLVDMSHISDASFADALEVVTLPIVASHSNSRAVCNVKRNLTDEQFLEYVRRGGLVGINYFTQFIRETDQEKSTLDDLYKHIEHFLALGGEKTIALGSDYDGAKMPEQLDSLEKVGDLYEYLLKRNLSESLVNDMFYNNAARLFSQYI